VNEPLVHASTRRTIELLMQSLPQSTLISGPRGVGLLRIARQLAGQRLGAILQPQDTKEQPDSQSGIISVEMIRRLYNQTRAKQVFRHIIIIDDADRMSHGAQSAFLKLLEEPNDKIYFILTSHQPQKLLATIHSRVQHTTLRPLSLEQSSSFIASLGITDAVKKSQLQFIAGGLPAELSRLVESEPYFQERAEIISDARDFLQADTYKKMLVIQKYRSDRTRTILLIESALQILRRSISAKPQYALIAQLERLLGVEGRIHSNANIQLQLARFVI
jgi:hypothetical protein